MTRNEAVFHILVGIMTADGEIVPEESRIVSAFIAEIKNSLDFDPVSAARILSQMDTRERIEIFSRAVDELKTLSDSQKYDVLDRVVDMIMADNKVHPSEGVVFDIIRNIWGLDIRGLLRKKGILS